MIRTNCTKTHRCSSENDAVFFCLSLGHLKIFFSFWKKSTSFLVLCIHLCSCMVPLCLPAYLPFPFPQSCAFCHLSLHVLGGCGLPAAPCYRPFVCSGCHLFSVYSGFRPFVLTGCHPFFVCFLVVRCLRCSPASFFEVGFPKLGPGVQHSSWISQHLSRDYAGVA